MKNDKNTTPPEGGKKPAEGVQLSCKVIKGGLVVGAFKKGRGKVIALPEDVANALEKRGDVRVLGPV